MCALAVTVEVDQHVNGQRYWPRIPLYLAGAFRRHVLLPKAADPPVVKVERVEAWGFGRRPSKCSTPSHMVSFKPNQ